RLNAEVAENAETRGDISGPERRITAIRPGNTAGRGGHCLRHCRAAPTPNPVGGGAEDPGDFLRVTLRDSASSALSSAQTDRPWRVTLPLM
ncbi:hypothetical protein QUF72_23085, partial [Desulfobacterales bacterium HSG2]|nr:hypothetical protein [Desulfobacterales bacterium HSG2]